MSADPEHAGASVQRQARRAGAAAVVFCMALCMLVAGVAAADVSPPAVTVSPRASAAAAAMREARERRLRDEQRAVEGRIQTLDRQLEVWELERTQPPQIDPLGVPGPLQDPVAERSELERRGLRDRDRLLEQRLRNERFDRERTRRMRAW